MAITTDTHSQEKDWESVWSRTGLATAIVDFGRRVYNWFFRRVLRRYLSPETTMLELGCGTSTLSVSLAPEVRKIVGLDISEAALSLSRKNAQLRKAANMEFVAGDCRNIPYENEFDFVWSQGLIEHFEDPAAVVYQHFKAVRPGGTVLISVPYYYSYHQLWYILTRPKILRPFWFWTDQIFFTKKMLRDIGKKITAQHRVFFIRPFILGIVFLELRKPKL